MEQMQIPDVIIAGLQNEGVDPSSAEAAKAMQFMAIAGTEENVVLDQFGNTVFLAIMGLTPYKKQKAPVAMVSMFSAERPEETANNIQKYIAALGKRQIAAANIGIGTKSVADAVVKLKLGHVTRSKTTGDYVLVVTFKEVAQ